MVVGLEKCACSGGIYDTEISLDTHGPRICVEKMREILDRAARLESFRHQDSLTVHLLGRDFVIFDIVRCRVHHSETCIVHAHPGLFKFFIGSVEQSYITEISFGWRDILDFIIDSAGVTMLP